MTDMSTAVEVPVLDDTPPTVAVTSPAAGSNVSGAVTLSATAADNVGVSSVQFLVDGTLFGGTLGGRHHSLECEQRSARTA